jgi:excisionase family DNA binding protein
MVRVPTVSVALHQPSPLVRVAVCTQSLKQLVHASSIMEQNETLPDWLTLAEVGAILSLSRTTLWRMERTGELPVVHFGRSVRVPRSWLVDLQAKRL